jgi:hypothetical protein
LAKLGFAAPGAMVAYIVAPCIGVLIGLIAGKPIWAKDAKIEAGMKAFVGALFGAGLMYVARRWLTMDLPISLGELSAPNLSLAQTGANGTLGGLAITSLAAIAAVLGGFYAADHDPSEGAASADAAKTPAKAGKRIAAAEDDAELEEEAEAPSEKRAKK